MKINKSMLFPLFICVIVWNVFLLISSRFSGDQRIEKETRNIYNSIISETSSLDGKFEQFGGRVLDGFILVISFPDLDLDYTSRFFSKIEGLGFTKMSKKLRYGSYAFCKEGSGFLIKEEQDLIVHYERKMPYCLDDK